MRYFAFQWQGPDGMRVHACEWKPDEGRQVKGVVGIVHGMGEHSGSYRHVADFFTLNGYAVLTFDQIGHGRTEGRRGDSRSYDALLDNVGILIDEMKRRYPDRPAFLYGHSMGGNLTLNYLLRRRPSLTGAVVASPWLRLVWAWRPAARLGRAFRSPSLRNRGRDPLESSLATSDPVMLRRSREDPLRHRKMTVRFFIKVHAAGRWALRHAPELGVPMLLMHGGDDRLTSPDASKHFAELACETCDFMEWSGFKHELHTERGRHQVFNYVLDWLNRRVESAAY